MTETDREEAALDRLLQIEPDSVPAHIRLGDLRANEAKDNLARHYYRRALALAEDQRLAEEAASEVRRAALALAEIERQALERRRTLLAERGIPPEQWSARLRKAVEGAGQRSEAGPSAPTDFDYPGLPVVPFFDPASFDWAAAVEAATADIRDELLTELRGGQDEFRAYLQSHTAFAKANTELRDKTDWSVLALCENSWVRPAVVQRFPRTWQAILETPLPAIYGWGPTVVFSKLKAGAHIAAHHGMFKTRLICHLPLIVPPGCRFRVGGEVREWEVGKLMIFDDTFEHEAWNDSSEDRLVLIFDIWRPELTEREKDELTALFHS